MPNVSFELEIAATVDRVWRTIVDVDSYPAFMENVVSTRALTDEAPDPDAEGNIGLRSSAWSILLKGAVLEWEEHERIDHDRHLLEFHQLDGDMERLDGFWQVTPVGTDRAIVQLEIDFRIGIPLLADMLNPLAAQAIHDNSRSMLLAVERRLDSRLPA